MFAILGKIWLFVILPIGLLCNAFEQSPELSIQIDSLINEKYVNNSETQLDLLVLYHEALKEKRQDSIALFKNLALLNADLGQPQDALKFTEKYINSTLDLSIIQNPAYDSISGTEEHQELNDRYNVKIDIQVLLFLFAAIIGIFFTITINFIKRVKRGTKFFISGFVGVHTLFLLEFVFYISNYRFYIPHIYLIASSVALWYGPFLYFYFKSLGSNFKFKWTGFLHFVPNILLFIYLVPIYALSANEKIGIMLYLDDNYNDHRYVVFWLKVLSLAVYAFLIGRLNYRNKSRNNTSREGLQSVNNWKRTIYRIHVSYVLIYMLYGLSVSGILGVSTTYLTYAMVGSMAMMILYIAYMSYVQPAIFRESLKDNGEDIFIAKYQKSGLTEALSEELKDYLIQLFTEEKIYKNNDLNLEKLSEKLGTTRHNASQIINEHFNMNFFELVNKFRISEALRIFNNDTYGNLNIIDVAFEVGYNNKVTFNKAFKKETALTPSEFLQLEDKKSIQVNLQ